MCRSQLSSLIYLYFRWICHYHSLVKNERISLWHGCTGGIHSMSSILIAVIIMSSILTNILTRTI